MEFTIEDIDEVLELRCDDYSVEATIQAEYDAWVELYAQIQEYEGDR